jgi:hypothetical protein
MSIRDKISASIDVYQLALCIRSQAERVPARSHPDLRELDEGATEGLVGRIDGGRHDAEAVHAHRRLRMVQRQRVQQLAASRRRALHERLRPV